MELLNLQRSYIQNSVVEARKINKFIVNSSVFSHVNLFGILKFNLNSVFSEFRKLF